jgi:hypothetical protein
MRAEDQFHVGIVVDDFEGTVATLSDLFGYEWCDEMGAATPVRLPTGDDVFHLSFVYSKTSPRLEIIRAVPGTFWQPVVGSTIHHVGYWSDDVAADAADLERRGYVWEASGLRPDGVAYWTFHRNTAGFRTELVSRALQPVLEQYWATGKVPSG